MTSYLVTLAERWHQSVTILKNKTNQNKTQKTLAKQEPKISTFYFYDIFQAFGLKYLTSVLFYTFAKKIKNEKMHLYSC